jgi:hypothetical protein
VAGELIAVRDAAAIRWFLAWKLDGEARTHVGLSFSFHRYCSTAAAWGGRVPPPTTQATDDVASRLLAVV